MLYCRSGKHTVFVTLTTATGKVTCCFLSTLSTEHKNTTLCGRKIENTAICMIGINSSCLHIHKSPSPNYSTGYQAAPFPCCNLLSTHGSVKQGGTGGHNVGSAQAKHLFP